MPTDNSNDRWALFAYSEISKTELTILSSLGKLVIQWFRMRYCKEVKNCEVVRNIMP